MMQTKSSEALATTFSRASAPPAPLIRRSSRSTRGPVHVERQPRGLVQPHDADTGRAQRGRARLRAGTAAATSPGRAASCSMNSAAVLPVPIPMVVPGVTYSTAATATARFCSSRVIDCHAPPRPGNGRGAQPQGGEMKPVNVFTVRTADRPGRSARLPAESVKLAPLIGPPRSAAACTSCRPASRVPVPLPVRLGRAAARAERGGRPCVAPMATVSSRNSWSRATRRASRPAPPVLTR